MSSSWVEMQIIKIIMENMIDIPQNAETTATVWPRSWSILSEATSTLQRKENHWMGRCLIPTTTLLRIAKIHNQPRCQIKKTWHLFTVDLCLSIKSYLSPVVCGNTNGTGDIALSATSRHNTTNTQKELIS